VLKTDVVVGGSSERAGLPGHNGPGVAAGDVDADHRCEVVFLTKDSTLHILDGATQYPFMTWEDSLGNIRALDKWREEVGLRYPCEEQEESPNVQ